jgi:DNA-binding SARP family transcriptional activator
VQDVRFAVLGPVRAWQGQAELGLGSPQQRAVLATLLVHQGAQVTSEGLIDAIWGEQPPASAMHAIRVYIHRLRLALGREGPGEIRFVGGGYALDLDTRACDLTRFNRLITEARHTREDADPAAAADLYAQALALWTGPALAGIPGPYAVAQRTRLNELRLTAQEEHLATLVDLGSYDQAATDLATLTAAHPLRERLRELQMLALYRAGRQAEALDAYQQTRLLLDEELGVDPGPGLRAIHQRILAMDPTLLTPAPAPAPAPSRAPADVAAPTPVPAQLPADIAHFTGRADHVRALTTLAAQAARTVVVTAIGGTAGIGKTALAVHWAHRHAAQFPDGALYVNLRGFDPAGPPLPATTALRGFLDVLAVPSARIPAGLEAQAGLYRSTLSGKRVLIVLDNAHDPEQVRPLLPGTPGCLVLVTSRDKLTGLIALDGAHSLTLDLLTAHEARELLTRRLGAARVEADDTTEELIELCAYLPLALNITAARAAMRPGFPLSAFAAELREARGRLSALDVGDPAANVRAVFSWSYQALGDAAARLFRLLGTHPGPDITVPAAASLAAVDRDRARAALDELTRAHLLTEHTPGRYTFHDLLRLYATEQTHTHDTDQEREQALRRALDHYVHTAYDATRVLNSYGFPTSVPQLEPGVTPEALADNEQAWDWFTAEHPVVLAAITRAAAHGLDTHVCRLAEFVSIFLFRGGHWHDYRATQTDALAAAERRGDLTDQAHAHRHLGQAHVFAQNHPEAQARLESAAALYRQVGDLIGQARVNYMLGTLLRGQGRYQESIEHVQRALSAYREAGDRLGQAGMLNSIGWTYSQLGDYEQAVAYCQDALACCREAPEADRGPSSQVLEAGIRDSLGHAHHHLGHHRQAIECYRQALDLFSMARNRYEQAGTLSRLGDAYDATGDHDAARDVWEQAETIFEELQHSDVEDVRRKLKGLG